MNGAAASSGLIFLGGGLGAVARYWVGQLVAQRAGAVFPWGTLAVNVSGSFVIGLFMVVFLRSNWDANWRLFFAVGLLGGYTTFSSFSWEALGLLQSGSYALASAYAALSVGLGLGACYLGMVLARVAGAG